MLGERKMYLLTLGKKEGKKEAHREGRIGYVECYHRHTQWS